MKINIQTVGNTLREGQGTLTVRGFAHLVHKDLPVLLTVSFVREMVSHTQGQGSLYADVIWLNLSFLCWRSENQKSSVICLLFI